MLEKLPFGTLFQGSPRCDDSLSFSLYIKIHPSSPSPTRYTLQSHGEWGEMTILDFGPAAISRSQLATRYEHTESKGK